MAADALTDIDLGALRAAHEANDGIATLAVKRVSDVSEFGVVITGSDGRIQGFQEKPDPAEALSDLASCMIYVLDREIFDYFPDQPVVDFALRRVPGPARQRRPVPRPRIDAYWNDVGSLPEYLQGNLDAVEGAVERRAGGRRCSSRRAGTRRVERGDPGVSGRVLVGDGCDIDPSARLDGPLVIGDGCDVGAGARVKDRSSCRAPRCRRARSSRGAVYGAARRA